MTTPTTPWYKKRQVLGLTAAILVAGAIVAGVLGGRASKHDHFSSSGTEAVAVKSDAQSGEIKSVLDALVNVKATETGSEAPAVPPATTIVKPQAPASPTSGTFTNLAPAGSAASSSSSSGNALVDALIPDVKAEDAAAIDTSITSLQNQATAGIVQQQQVAAKTMSALVAASGGAFCYPKTAQELHDAVDNAACTIIALNSGEYRLKKQIVIRRTVIIIGNPLFLPTIDPEKNERSFHVVAGGYLELRYLRLHQGIGRVIERPGLPPIDLRLGTMALVDLGGRFTASGCLFEIRTQTLQSLITEFEKSFTHLRLTVGSYVAVLGGTVDLTGCTFWRYRPLGNGNLFEINIGRDLLLVAGTARVTGSLFSNVQLFHNKPSAGGIHCVLGGNLIITGWALNTITGFNAQWGTGLQAYVGGGNLILTSVHRFTASVALARGGFGLFSASAGNLVVTGYAQASARVVGAEFGTATFSVGAGTLTSIGTALASYHVSNTWHGAGAAWFNGAGVMTVVGQVRFNFGTTTNQMGIGMHLCNIAGVSQGIYMSSYTAALTRNQIGAGTEYFMSAGFVTYVRVFRYRNIGAGIFIGKGNQIYVNRGAGVFIRNRQSARILIDWRTTRNVYTIAGQGVGRAGANTNLYMDASGRYPLGNLGLNDTNKYGLFPKKIDTTQPGKRDLQGEKPPKMVELSHLPLFRKLQEKQAETDNNADLIFPRSFLLAVDDKVYQGTLLVPDEADIEAAKNQDGDDVIPGLAFFRAVENLAGPVDARKNMLRISTSNTDCLACDVPADQLVGDTPCVASNQCAGKDLFDVLNLDETPQGLKDFAGSMGWGDVDKATGQDLAEPLPEPGADLGDADAVPADPAVARRRARALQEAGAPNRPEQLPDVTVVEGELAIYCNRGADATGDSACGHDYHNVRAALAYALGDTTGQSKDFSVSAWDKKLAIKAPQFANYFVDLAPVLAALEPAALEGAADAAATVFGFTVTTKDEAQRKAVSDKIDALVNDPASVLEKVDWLDSSATAYVDAKLSRKGAIVVPGAPLGAKTADLFGGSIAPAVLVKEEHSYGGLHTAAPGETYELALQNFPVGTVNVNVVDAATGKPVGNQSATTSVPVKLTKPGTPTSVAWSLPEGLPAGDYLLEASLANIPAISAQTMPFKVVA